MGERLPTYADAEAAIESLPIGNSERGILLGLLAAQRERGINDQFGEIIKEVKKAKARIKRLELPPFCD